MDVERERRLNELLGEALDLPEAERRGFVEDACGDDREMLSELFAFLEVENDLDDFLEAPAVAEAADVRVDEGRTQIGGYEIVEHLGDGGMGEVYIGRDPRLDRRVALKTVPPELAGHPGLLKRFRREARSLAAFNHPHIVTIHSVEEDDGVPFLTMELVEGRTLEEAVPEDGLALDEWLRLAVALSDALAEAHRRGIVHRDLKPRNIMITPEGQAKVLDFGIVKIRTLEHAESRESKDLLVTRENLTQKGQLIGTLDYMAPEQKDGADADARSDLYALGLILYEAAVGRHPLKRRPERLAEHQGGDDLSILSERSGFPRRLDALIALCLKYDPAERLASAAELRDALRAYGNERIRSRARRPWLAALLASVLLGAWAVSVRSPSAPAAPVLSVQEAIPETKQISIALFENRRDDPEHEWMASGIAEMLATDLSRTPGIRARVVEDASEGTTILRGSYFFIQDVLQVHVTFIDPTNDETQGAVGVQGQGEASLFELIDDLGGQVRDHLGAKNFTAGKPVRTITTDSIEAWQIYVEARLAHRASQREEAVEGYQEALRIDPDFALVYADLARLYRSRGELESARKYAEAAVDRADRLPLDVRFNAESTLYGTRWSTTGKAIESYAVASQAYPERRNWRNNLARRYAEIERFEEAAEIYEALIDDETDFWGTYQGVANVYAALGDFDKGFRKMNDFLVQDPDNWLMHYSLGWHLTEWGRLDQAENSFQRAAELRPDALYIVYGRWRAAVLQEDWEAASRAVESLITTGEDFGVRRGALSKARTALLFGRVDEARQALESAIDGAAGADRAQMRTFLAEMSLASGDAEDARAQANLAREEGREQWPELRGVYLEALAAQALGDVAAADALVEVLRASWRRQPNVVEERQIHHLLGRLALERGRFDEAVTELRRAASMLPPRGMEFHWHVLPDHVPVWTSLGEAELAAGRPQEALKRLDAVAESGSERIEQPLDWVRSLYLRSQALELLGETQEAEQSLKRFLDFRAGTKLDFSRR